MCNGYDSLTEEELKLINRFVDFRDNSKEYTPTDEERSQIVEILKCTPEFLAKMEFKKHTSGKIIVTTPKDWWMALCGREWLVDLEAKTSELLSMN